jgi:hypothetical protein
MTMENPYSLKSVPLDSARIQGWESNNLSIQNKPIEDYFCVSGQLPFTKTIPFDFVVLSLSAEKTSGNGMSNVDIELKSPKGNTLFDGSMGVNESAQIELDPSGFYRKGTILKCFCSDETPDSSFTAAVYLKRVVIIEL